ncbi:glycosyltransferase family 4 protein [Hymenobacter sp. BT188]|uniref:glycosyltransferase family 4 protein n=1 Tax=Hymenobacter sp. BT188 TaxID=2763504 RepID=UPI001650FE98|nr:glycosyltransferase family 4 protein [Hymenobacter sp. BT188]MBC6609139.1 glycosyltransferase family 4 protein [Hymenobacter sp. BT188]
MKIAIASKGDPSSISTWSSIPYHIIYYLKKEGHEISCINLKDVIEPWYYNWYRRFYFKIQKKWFLSAVEPYLLKKIAQQFDAEVEEIKPDVVLVIHGDFLAYTTFNNPAIIIHDTTFASLIDYYPSFTNLTKRSIKNGSRMYQLALNKCSSAVFSATWASNSAIRDYQIDTDKVVTIPFGANLSTPPEKAKVLEYIDNRVKNETLNFLFLGADWKRKGWEDALNFVKILNSNGINSKLIAVGCEPIIKQQDVQYVLVKGFYDKSNLEENYLLEKLLAESHALLLPSIAECYGCVYCEANAYGLPALGRDTGGVSEAIKEYKNGLLLGPTETIKDFAKRWLAIWENKEVYRLLSLTARREFEERLNYGVFTKKLEELCYKVISR